MNKEIEKLQKSIDNIKKVLQKHGIQTEEQPGVKPPRQKISTDKK